MALLIVTSIITLWVMLFILRSRLWSKCLTWFSSRTNKTLKWVLTITLTIVLLVLTPYMFLFAFLLGNTTLEISTRILTTKDVLLFFLTSAIVILPFFTLFMQTILETMPVKLIKFRQGSVFKRYLYSFPYTLIYFVLAYYVVYQLLVGGYINI